MEGFDELWASACALSKQVHAGGWLVVEPGGANSGGRVLHSV